MKKSVILKIVAFALLTVFSLVLSSCTFSQAVQGLVYEEVDGGYQVSTLANHMGLLGAIFDNQIFFNPIAVVPEKHNDLPVIAITDGGFSGTSELTAIILPSTIKRIGNDAFSQCYVLASASLSEGVEFIGDNAFAYCFVLADVNIPSTVTTIGNNAFRSTLISNVIISENVTSIGYGPFALCSNLESIEVSEKNEYYKSVDGTLYTKDGKLLVQYPYAKTDKSFIVPDGVTTIGSEAFLNSSIENLSLPASLTAIEPYAFSQCDKLVSVILPEGITCISESAFSRCKSLTSVSIPVSVTKIDVLAFMKCESLTTINYGGTVAQWKELSQLSWAWNAGTGNYTVYCIDGTVSK